MSVRWQIKWEMRGMGGPYSSSTDYPSKPAAERAFDKLSSAPETFIKVVLFRNGVKQRERVGYQFDDPIPF